MDYKEMLKSSDYDFLRTDPRLKEPMIIALGGSHAYGTNIETSDLDIRGCAKNSKQEILLGRDFEQVTDTKTDTTIYSFKKIVNLLSNCNPNVIEIMGLEPWQYLHISETGQMLLDNKKLFLSRKAVHSFGGYANQQLRRLENCSVKRATQEKQETHILKTLNNVQEMFDTKFEHTDGLKLYIDESRKDDMLTEIFMDINLSHYPLRDFNSMYGELINTVKEYNKLGIRNTKAKEHGKLAKHAMHLVRLYYMCFDILENQEIVTYRRKEHDLLMRIRNGEFLDDNNQPTEEFFEMVDSLEKRFEYAKKNTSLPSEPNKKAIEELVMTINESVVRK